MVDTPGFNPGASEAAGHFEITQRVCTDVADVALILMPSDQPFSASISCFLGDNLRHNLHRCVFVLTKADQKPTEERREIIHFVRQRLAAEFQLSCPRIYCLSAVTMLPVVCIPEMLKDQWPRLQREFHAFQRDTWALLKRQRSIIIAEHTESLVVRAAATLRDRLAREQRSLRDRIALAESQSTRAIEEVTTQMADEATADIARNFQTVMQQLDKMCQQAKQRCIDETNGISTNNSVIETIRKKCKEEVDGVVRETSNALTTTVRETLAEARKRMRKSFTAHYTSLPRFRMKPSQMPDMEICDIGLGDMEFTASAEIAYEASDIEAKWTFGGALAGAAAGAAIASVVPGIGTALGAVIGFMGGCRTGSDMGKERSANVTQRFRNSLHAGISKYIDSCYATLMAAVNAKQRLVVANIHAYAAKHIETYGTAVSKLIADDKKEKTRLRAAIDELTAHIGRLEDIESQASHNLLLMKGR